MLEKNKPRQIVSGQRETKKVSPAQTATTKTAMKTCPTSKRDKTSADIGAFKKGLEAAWKVIGPPPPPKKKQPADDAKKTKSVDKSTKKPADKKPNLSRSKSESRSETSSVSSNAEIGHQKLPAAISSLAEDLKAAASQYDEKNEVKKAKGPRSSSVPVKSKAIADKAQDNYHKKPRPVGDREAIQQYIKQQKLARHSAEVQKKAEQARLERKKQANLKAVYEQQQAVARIPVRELLPEGFSKPRTSLKAPSFGDKSYLSSENDDSLSTVVMPGRIKSPESTKVHPEPKSTVATVANALIPDTGRTRRVCAILESAMSLQAKLRAEVERVDRFITVQQTHPEEKLANQRGPSPRLLQELTAISDAVSTVISPDHTTPHPPDVRDFATSPISFPSPKRKSPSPSPVKSPHRLEVRERPFSVGTTSPLSTAPCVETSYLSTALVLPPPKYDNWNVASVVRRSFGTGTTPARTSRVDAELQTTFQEFTVTSVNEVGVQSAEISILESSRQQAKPITSRPDLVEACIQTTTSPLKSVVEDQFSNDDLSTYSFHRLSPQPPDKPTKVTEMLREEDERQRTAPEVLDEQLRAELDLLASLNGYHEQLDNLERSRTANEQHTDVAGLVSLMNAVENHVSRVSMGGSAIGSTKKHTVPMSPQTDYRSGMPSEPVQPALTAYELRQDIERRFEALEAATGRRMAQDSESLLQAHLRTSIAVSDLTRQLANIQRQSLLSPDVRNVDHEESISKHRYHRRQTFSPPRPPAIQRDVETLQPPPRAGSALSTTPRPVSELTQKSESARSIQEESATESVSEAVSISESSDEKGDQSSRRLSNIPSKPEDQKVLGELISQQARQSALRFRNDTAELALREKTAKRRTKQELALLEQKRRSLGEPSRENKKDLERLNILKAKILAQYGKEKKHLEHLRKSSERLASEQRSLAHQLRRSLPAFKTEPDEEESIAISESALSDTQDLDLTMELLQVQLEQIGGDTKPDRLSRTIIDQ